MMRMDSSCLATGRRSFGRARNDHVEATPEPGRQFRHQVSGTLVKTYRAPDLQYRDSETLVGGAPQGALYSRFFFGGFGGPSTGGSDLT